MIKNGSTIQCTYCQEPAIKGTEPPVCEKHKELHKKASEGPSTLKELDSLPFTVTDEAANDSSISISVRGDLASSDTL